MTEADIRSQLGIPTWATEVIILNQSSHMDWDWLETFPSLCSNGESEYFQRNTRGLPAFEILDRAVDLVLENASAKPPFYYSVAEVGFLQAYASLPGKLARLQQCKELLHLCGGGITSPDNLLPHGETFIRNSLVAQRWNAATLGLPVQNIWIPDDFGHDSQLPVVVAAMGLLGAGFSRAPGSTMNYNVPSTYPFPKSAALTDQLHDDGVDFFWLAGDGSRILGHFMEQGYGQGDGLGNTTSIADCYRDNRPGSKTPYVFIPVGSDFLPPVGSHPIPHFSSTASLPDLVKQYNESTEQGTKGPFAVAATFDHYVQLVWANGTGVNLRPFDAVPYWLGIFASRPANKILHYDASRTLLAAEVFGLVADSARVDGPVPARPYPNPARLAAQQEAWASLVPSTHHDYITGTSGTGFVDVNAVEQVPLLACSQLRARALCLEAVQVIAHGVGAAQGTNPAVVCNPLGFGRYGMVALPGAGAASVKSAAGSGTSEMVQPAADGSLLLLATVPSLGYSTVLLQDAPPQSRTEPVTGVVQPPSFVLRNEFIHVEIDATQNGGITLLLDLKSATPQVNLLSGIGNDLSFYVDSGNIYRYGNEPEPEYAAGELTMTGLKLESTLHTLTETGPVRTTVVSTGTLNGRLYTRTYSLVAGEPFLRMSLTGSLPVNQSLFCTFRFAAGSVTSLTHGTPYHWSDATTVPYWPLPVFYATHNYLLPVVNGGVAAALYHEGMPSWGYDDQGTLLGNVLRNALGTGSPQGAEAADFATHTQHYALRVPSGLGPPSATPRNPADVARTGQPLREALQFNTPMMASSPPLPPPPPALPPPPPRCPATYSLASVQGASPVIITAAKAADDDPGAVVLRLYNPAAVPDPAPQPGQPVPPPPAPVEVVTAVGASGAVVTTALEGPFMVPDLQPPTATLVASSPTGFSVAMPRALATVRLDPPAS